MKKQILLFAVAAFLISCDNNDNESNEGSIAASAVTTDAVVSSTKSVVTAPAVLDQENTFTYGGGASATGPKRLGQSFVAGISGNLAKVELELKKVLTFGTPTFDITIYDAETVTKPIATSTKVIVDQEIGDSYKWYSFYFSGVTLVAGKKYIIVENYENYDTPSVICSWKHDNRGLDQYPAGNSYEDFDKDDLLNPAADFAFRTFVNKI